MAKLRYSFLFPFRWLKEDRQFLKKNFERSLPLHKNQVLGHPRLLEDEPQIYFYSARIKQHAFQPKPYKMDETEMTGLLKDVFPGSQCRYFEKFFVQKAERTGLPIMELEIFY